VRFDAGDRVADRHGGAFGEVGGDLLRAAADGGFGRPVLVEDPRGRRVPPPRAEQAGRHRLPAEHEGPGRAGERAGRQQRVQQREVGGGHLDQVQARSRGQLRRQPAGLPPGGIETHGPAGDQRHEQGGGRQVEADGRRDRRSGTGRPGIGARGPPHVVADGPVGDHDALGDAGGTGGEQDVGQVVRRRRRDPRTGGGRDVVLALLVDEHDLHVGPVAQRATAPGQ
jgi:hypothetical protein